MPCPQGSADRVRVLQLKAWLGGAIRHPHGNGDYWTYQEAGWFLGSDRKGAGFWFIV